MTLTTPRVPHSGEPENKHLVKADEVQLATHVDPLGADAEDALSLQSPLGVNDARGQCGR